MTKGVCSECGCTSFDDPEEALAWLKEPTIEQMIEELGSLQLHKWNTGDESGWTVRAAIGVAGGYGLAIAIRALHEKWKEAQ